MKKNIFKYTLLLNFIFILFSSPANAVTTCSDYTPATCPGSPCTGKQICSIRKTFVDGSETCMCADPLIAPATSASSDNGMLKLTMPVLQISIPGMDKFSTPGKCSDDPTKLCVNWIGEYIAGIYKYAVGVVGILATVILMVGGVIWLMAGGDASRITEAKAWITAAITGLVIMLCSYVILYQINPDIIGAVSKPLELTIVQKTAELASEKSSGKAGDYASMSCPSTSELTSGVQVYTTGYYQPPWGSDHRSLCNIAMNCSCPAGRDNVNTCGDIFTSARYATYPSCLPFSQSTPYCNKTSSGVAPTMGDVAVPGCIPAGTKLCVGGKNYTARDSGSAIAGHRVDIWSGTSLDTALANSGKVVTMTIGPCN